MTDKEILDCTHEGKMLHVRYEMSNGRYQLRKQCSFCGYLDSQNLKHNRVANINNVPIVNIFKKDRREQLYEHERERLYEESKPERIKDWERKQKENKIAYDRYLNSDEWRVRRDKAFERDSERCVLCHREGNHVHHMTYRNIFNEDIRDLITVCTECHEYIHGRVFEKAEKKENDEEREFF